MGFAVGCWKFPIATKMRAAVLDGVAGFAEVLDAVVEWNDAGDFFAHLPTGLTTEQVRAIGISSRGQVAQDFPFGAGFADLARNFRTERDAAFGGGFGSTVVLFVSRFGGEENDFFFCVEEHLVGENDVLVDAYG